jgi:hypothetical protein
MSKTLKVARELWERELESAEMSAAKRLGYEPSHEEERQATRAQLRKLYPPAPLACGAAVNLECDCPRCQGCGVEVVTQEGEV